MLFIGPNDKQHSEAKVLKHELKKKNRKHESKIRSLFYSL